jgi:hypothetical protein
MVAFTDRERTDNAIKSTVESLWEYHDRCNRPSMERLRLFIEELFELYPASGRSKMVARFRTTDEDFLAVYFELLLHGVFVRSGFVVVSIEPPTDNGASGKPDFLMQAPDGRQFYVEATCVHYTDRIGKTLPGAGWPEPEPDETRVREACRGKMDKYGEPRLPFVLAVNSLNGIRGATAFEDVLEGTFAVQETVISDGSVHSRAERGPLPGLNDGVLGMPGIANISAFLMFAQARPGNERRIDMCLYHNPYARLPLTIPLPNMTLARQRPVWTYTPGQHLAEWFGLPESWHTGL